MLPMCDCLVCTCAEVDMLCTLKARSKASIHTLIGSLLLVKPLC